MLPIIAVVIKDTIGLLVSKGRDWVVEKLKDGDVTDKKFRSLLIREIDNISSKLDALARQHLLTSISFFKQGLVYLFTLLDEGRVLRLNGIALTSPGTCSAARFRSETTVDTASAIVDSLKKMQLAGLSDSHKRALIDAKEAFKTACLEATKAFNNEALSTTDRIRAMAIRAAAKILEKVDYPEDAITACLLYLEELNSMPAVQGSFKIEVEKSFMAYFNQAERRGIICSVCKINRIIYDFTQTVDKGIPLLLWPTVDTGNNKFDPLRDVRVTEITHEQGTEHCSVSPQSFSQREGEENSLKLPSCIAANLSGKFIFGDNWDKTVKMFDNRGKFINLFSLPVDSFSAKLPVRDLATDSNGNIYVLLQEKTPETERQIEKFEIYVFTENAEFHHKLSLREGFWTKMIVNDKSKVVLLEEISRIEDLIHVYENDGQFFRSFGKGILKIVLDITAMNDGHVMVLALEDWSANYAYVHIFSEHGHHLNVFKLRNYDFTRFTFYLASNLIVVAGNNRMEKVLHVDIYSKDGEFVRCTQLDGQISDFHLKEIGVSKEGHIALLSYSARHLNMWKVLTV
ncbi:uncharacterized protein LOC111329679 [Stylophora pistillata]|uniref:uncharacterized protein LOC111329679 n=1 Tax=Stylophora pistillata TaxID=50429 RepID=UPI000C04CE25|nr:uncharacterized protein LOC111329679 [Stylophora pistillata]